MFITIASLVLNLAAAPLIPEMAPVSPSGGRADANCSEACQEMRNGQNQLITYFCIPVPNNQGDGSGCSATISECTITTSTSCNPQVPEGDDELLVSAADGRVLSSVAICATARTIVKDDRIDFAHLRQRNALAFRMTQDRLSETAQ